MIVHLLKTAKPVKGAPALFPSERVSVGACPLCGMAVTETPKGFFLQQSCLPVRNLEGPFILCRQRN